MAIPSSHEVTQLLIAWSDGDQAALKRLMPLVDKELHRLAHHYMRRENARPTLQTTALVNKAYLKLSDQKHVQWKNRAHFFALSAQLMRRILVDHGGLSVDETAEALAISAVTVMRECSMAKALLYNSLNNET